MVMNLYIRDLRTAQTLVVLPDHLIAQFHQRMFERKKNLSAGIRGRAAPPLRTKKVGKSIAAISLMSEYGDSARI